MATHLDTHIGMQLSLYSIAPFPEHCAVPGRYGTHRPAGLYAFIHTPALCLRPSRILPFDDKYLKRKERLPMT
ncbi:hypothetical protein [Limibacterium fermenti]|uniref:hypothetical protein n=1 Tax=Limibacterium fermenti TaxID=3229863 RepID=UPI003A7980B8